MASQSPPKRVTRARAAANKDSTIKIATASTRALTNSSANLTKSSLAPAPAVARRTRASSHLDQDDLSLQPQHHQQQQSHNMPQMITKTSNVKPKTRTKRSTVAELAQVAETEAQIEEEQLESLPQNITRGRAKKLQLDVPPIIKQPSRATRGKSAKDETSIEDEPHVATMSTKTTRGRPVSKVAVRPAPSSKKAVQFEAPADDKENDAASKTTGLKAKPIRKAAASTRATRTKQQPPSQELKSSPLSPKKITQVSPSKIQESDDELATTHKPSLKPSPIKSSIDILSAAHKLNDATSAKSIPVAVNRIEIPEQPEQASLSASILASPARRLPSSPFKGSLKASPSHAPGKTFLQSPFKPHFSATKPATTRPAASFNNSILQSPARRATSPLKSDVFTSPSKPSSSPFKSSLMASPAKRSLSPIKGYLATSPAKSFNTSAFSSTPKASTFHITRYATPKTLNRKAFRPGKVLMTGTPRLDNSDKTGNGSIKPFTGRLSSIAPRDIIAEDSDMTDAHPEYPQVESCLVSKHEDVATPESDAGDTSISCEDEVDEKEEAVDTITTPPRQSYTVFGMRHRKSAGHNFDDDSDSEDELASDTFRIPNLSTRAVKSPPITPRSSFIPQTPATKTIQRSSTKVGFTPLAQQLNAWVAHSPNKTSILQGTTALPSAQEIDDLVEHAPLPSDSLFEAEMTIREDERLEQELLAAESTVGEPVGIGNEDLTDGVLGNTADMDAMTFVPQLLDDQDLELAIEAEEMSLLDFTNTGPDTPATTDAGGDDGDCDAELNVHEDLDEHAPFCNEMDPVDYPVLDTSVQDELENMAACDADHDSTMSEASQEYGDENDAPIQDHAHMMMNVEADVMVNEDHEDATEAVTPRPVRKHARISYNTPLPRYSTPRVLHTTSKVPLKPAGPDSPLKIQARSMTAVQHKTKRPSTISSTLVQATPQRPALTPSQLPIGKQSSTPVSLSKTSSQPESSVLNGAVVYVDVHTVEGADASALFTELLTSIGARCVKSWSWKSASQESSPEDASLDTIPKTNITHVVFKDGGKRTIEKVREAAGAVACVGVGWVLDCERSNEWVSEAPYEIDTSLVPRGGHRRRKSMEPRTLRNLNNTHETSTAPTPRAVSSPITANTKSSEKFNRRRSIAWVRSPASDSASSHSSPSAGLQAFEEETLLLSPAPQTPDEVEIMRRVEACLDVQEEPTPFSKRQILLQQTVPVQRHVVEGIENVGAGQEHRGALMQRLMMARRKSLQWAPKVGSPLSRTRAFSP